MTVRIGENDVTIPGVLTVLGGIKPDITRSNLAQESFAVFPIQWGDWRVFDAFATLLPGTPANDDLGLVGGTHGTGTPSLQTEDLKTAGATNKRARCVVSLPAEFDEGADVKLRFSAGMVTTTADVTATIDVEVYKLDREAGVDGADLCTTAAQSINSLTLADKDFVITGSGLSPGDQLDVRLTLAINDGSGATAVIGIVGAAELLCDIRG